MAQNDRELEVKYWVAGLQSVEAALLRAGAQRLQGRVFERNLRFDTPGGELGRAFRVLRLRQDEEARLTYKGPGSLQDGVRLRQEIELTVGDFEAARRLLEALGYQVSMAYEKYRTTYRLGGVLATLDEMPYGDFIELEGPTPAEIRAASERLGLEWSRRINDSYTALFERLRQAQGLDFTDLTFDCFRGWQGSLAAVGLQQAGGQAEQAAPGDPDE
jgi:adenylate cyclase class 2